MNIKNIKLAFENCETHTYKGSDIDDIVMDKVLISECNEYDMCYDLGEFYIKLNPEANKSENVDENFRDWCKNPFNRIVKINDICIVILVLEDDTEIKFNLEWCKDDWKINYYQKSLVDVDGYLHVSVNNKNNY